jgi:hypothetical protein
VEVESAPGSGDGPDRARPGVVLIDGVPTKHFRRDELLGAVSQCGAPARSIRPVQYEWHSYGLDPEPHWKATLPWDWLIVSRRKTAAVGQPSS